MSISFACYLHMMASNERYAGEIDVDGLVNCEEYVDLRTALTRVASPGLGRCMIKVENP
jgi:hypothetical protein